MRWAAWVVAGVLSAGCSSPDVDRTSPAVELGDPSFHATIEAYAGAPILAGNDVRILLNGDAIFPVLLQAIRSARTSITYAQYFFEEGPVADDVVAALAGRCRAGVPAHVLLDGVGTVSMPARHIDELKAAGCDVRTFRALRPHYAAPTTATIAASSWSMAVWESPAAPASVPSGWATG